MSCSFASKACNIGTSTTLSDPGAAAGKNVLIRCTKIVCLFFSTNHRRSKEARKTYLMLQWFSIWWSQLFTRLAELCGIVLEVFLISTVYSGIRLHQNLNTVCLMAMFFTSATDIVIFKEYVSVITETTEASKKFIFLLCSYSQPVIKDFSTVVLCQELNLERKRSQSLQKIQFQWWNIPVQNGMLLTILSDIIIGILINLLVTF